MASTTRRKTRIKRETLEVLARLHSAHFFRFTAEGGRSILTALRCRSSWQTESHAQASVARQLVRLRNLAPQGIAGNDIQRLVAADKIERVGRGCNKCSTVSRNQ